MSITIDYHDIAEALLKFNLQTTDYYLEFVNDVVYMHWVSCPLDIEDYLKGDRQCLDFQVKGTWLNADDFDENYIQRPFTNCRYILATN